MTPLLDRPLEHPLADRVPEQIAQDAVDLAQAALGLQRPATPPGALSLASVRGQAPPRVVLGFGLGVDSSVMVTLHCCRRGP
ncbi:hypothetical protein NQK81_01760 [Amycolatopsis roodepoortensis]|uniref:hypothetical protein n=1 Tax=Amycolatopsis roodepoortensis TaxID=700274 RepID=UPI00214C46FE|nr:hypothetical protein [Amycolatopsis roodepoortensis]UUV32200.1 hypothetical protein NQK81_01760 [Amycolatopsis roodepoortensis]